MRRLLINISAVTAALVSSVVSLHASELVVPVGVVVQGNNVVVNVAPSSVITVDLVCEKVAFEPGVYARYAQKYLGVRAPLIAKSTATITSAKILKHTEGERSLMSNYSGGVADVVKQGELAVDLTSADVLPLEQAAEKAANEIFRLRRLRKDLIAGELGEGFFGGGLQAALNEIAQQEKAYTQLFFGSTERSTDRKSFSVSLTSGEKRHIVCRLSQSAGIVDDSDLSAEPVMLQITPSKSEKIVAPAPLEKSEIRKFRVADMSKCELFLGTKLLAQSTLSLFEFGYDLNYPFIKR